MKKVAKYNLIWLAFILVSYGILLVLYNVGIIDLFIDNALVNIGINVILAVGLNLIIGYSGQFSLGHAGFMAIGAYAGAIFAMQNPTYGGFFLGMLVGALLSGILALGVGIPTLRLKGDYLAIATLGVAEIIRILIVNLDGITNGPAGIFGIPQFTTWEMVFAFAVLTILIVVNFIHSGPGRGVLAVREDEIAAESMGVNTTKYKVMAFVVGAMTASVAGTLFAGYKQSVFPGDYGFMKSVDILIIVVFGGMGSTTGAVISAIVLGVMNTFLQDTGSLRMIIYALALIIIMIFKPSGLLGTWEFSVKNILTKITGKGAGSDATIDR